MPSIYKPGSRRGYKTANGRMTKNRIGWLRLVIGQFVLLKYNDSFAIEDEELETEEPTANELGPTYRLLFPRPGGRAITYDLTALTHEEFVAMRAFFMKVFELVEPVVIERDRMAQDAYDQGDDSFARIYRQAPQLVFREGAVGPDGQSIRDGSEDLPSGDMPEG